MNEKLKLSLKDCPSLKKMRNVVKLLKKDKARWNSGAWIHLPDSLRNQTINIIKEMIRWRERLEKVELPVLSLKSQPSET